MSKLYLAEFPDYDAGQEFETLGETLGAEFTDSSWHNDTCPSWSAETEFAYIVLHLDYANPALSEFAEYVGVTWERWSVNLLSAAPMDSGEFLPELSRGFASEAQAVAFARIMLAACKVAALPDLDSACAAIQQAAGQSDGGLAGIHFTAVSDAGLDLPEQWPDVDESERIRRIFEYAQSEFASMDKESE